MRERILELSPEGVLVSGVEQRSPEAKGELSDHLVRVCAAGVSLGLMDAFMETLQGLVSM